MEKMNLASTSTSCDEEPTLSQVRCPYPYAPVTPQATHDDNSKLSSPFNSPPSSPPSIGISEPGGIISEDDDFPVTPNSKRSGGKHRAADTFPHQESHHTSDSESKRHTKHFHPYHHRRPMLGDKHHDRAEQILRRNSCNQYSEGMSTEDQEALLRHIESMSTHSFHCAIHYKEAVRETLRLEFLYRGWLLETSRRLNVFNESLHHESETELGRADQELRWLLHVLIHRGETPRAAAIHQDHDGVPYLTAAREGSRKALDHADAEIAILKQSFPNGEKDDCDNKSEAVRADAVL
ncbi:hypothetical protein DEU56DRAFT_761096 [Suillus clintonianus]|uniref:uncharacterized protein n=1 Tax=Suillus clintonianus TaxID=1904413 RepID=UPI001B86AB39|nr:uncharacterized protein DEU56DRAFT_761096 [Suillus clintonianus]KAG2119186.1 hypothetical protein DEU56DRAFT_761096 [Suillus clintonianus]